MRMDYYLPVIDSESMISPSLSHSHYDAELGTDLIHNEPLSSNLETPTMILMEKRSVLDILGGLSTIDAEDLILLLNFKRQQSQPSFAVKLPRKSQKNAALPK